MKTFGVSLNRLIVIPKKLSPDKPARRKIRLILLILVVLFAGMQLIRPDLENPPVTGEIKAPPEVRQILERSCYNCHSNRPALAWFDRLTPVNFLVAADIRAARKMLNFSEWDSLAPDQQKAKLFEGLFQASHNGMPLKQYLLLHPDSKITGAEIGLLKNYLASLVPVKPAAPARIKAADDQYALWIQQTRNRAGNSGPDKTPSASVRPELNGIGYIGGFENWKLISSSDRFDNGTMRAILGNDVAVKAIKEHRISPWPKGSMFAKIAWEALTDSAGYVSPGEFKQVEFMIKDADKYASTDGWGWARWRGMDLKPYGKDALFTNECMNCHKPLQDKDFVFTMPLNFKDAPGKDTDLFNAGASLPATLPFDPLEWNFISSFFSRKDGTMSVLYGKGADRSLVTWSQQEDKHWFGANIPGVVSLVEKLSFVEGDSTHPVYERYEGKLLKRLASPDADTQKLRIAYILDRRPSVIP